MPAPIARWHPPPPADQELPEQEAGRRGARPLPYSPFVSDRLDRSGTLRLTLRNRGRQTAHFAIYRYDDVTALPVHVDVERVHTEELGVTAGAYDVAVQGPNRFWYELAGDPAGAAAGVEVGSDDDASSRRLHLELDNHGNREVTLSVRGLAYSDRTEVVTVRPAGADGSRGRPTTVGMTLRSPRRPTPPSGVASPAASRTAAPASPPDEPAVAEERATGRPGRWV